MNAAATDGMCIVIGMEDAWNLARDELGAHGPYRVHILIVRGEG